MYLFHHFFILVFLMVCSSSAYGVSALSDLQKIGQGKAYYLGFIKVYDVSLYSSELTQSHSILSPDVSKCLHIQYSVDIKKSDFIQAGNTVLTRQFSPEQLAQAQSGIDVLHAAYLDVEEGDTYTLCYNNTSGVTTLSYNGDELVSIDSSVFAEKYFSIWLGSTNPLDEDLRDDLLAGLVPK